MSTVHTRRTPAGAFGHPIAGAALSLAGKLIAAALIAYAAAWWGGQEQAVRHDEQIKANTERLIAAEDRIMVVERSIADNATRTAEQFGEIRASLKFLIEQQNRANDKLDRITEGRAP